VTQFKKLCNLEIEGKKRNVHINGMVDKTVLDLCSKAKKLKQAK